MKHGHVVGTKKESMKPGGNWYYAQMTEEEFAHITREWEAQQAKKNTTTKEGSHA